MKPCCWLPINSSYLNPFCVTLILKCLPPFTPVKCWYVNSCLFFITQEEKVQKNWVPIVRGSDELLFVYWSQPFIILKWDFETHKLAVIHNKSSPLDAWLSGSSPGMNLEYRNKPLDCVYVQLLGCCLVAMCSCDCTSICEAYMACVRASLCMNECMCVYCACICVCVPNHHLSG